MTIQGIKHITMVKHPTDYHHTYHWVCSCGSHSRVYWAQWAKPLAIKAAKEHARRANEAIRISD